MNKKQTKEKINLLKKEIDKIYEKADEIKWNYIQKNQEIIDGKRDEIIRLKSELDMMEKERNKDKKYFQPTGDWGSINYKMEIIEETKDLVLCFCKGYMGYVDRISGSSYSHPKFIIFEKGKKKEDIGETWNDGKDSFEYERGEREVALEKAKSKLREMSK